MAVIILVLGGVLFIYLYALVRQWRNTREVLTDLAVSEKPIVPVSLVDSDDAVLVAEGRGRLVFANDNARKLFDLNGNAPNLTLMAQKVQPPDTFRDIFAREGRVAFRVGFRQIEATSHAIPDDHGRRMVVVMRELTGAMERSSADTGATVQVMSVVSEISSKLAQTFESEDVLAAILESISSVIRFDSSEINQWQPDSQILRPLARTGDPRYAVELEQHGGAYKLDEGCTGWIARYRQPLVISEISTHDEVKPKIASYPFNSFVGVPLMAGDRFIGTLELASRQPRFFDYEDLDLLQTLAGQVAVALENTRLYQEQSDRVAELSGLHQIAQSMSALTDHDELFKQVNTTLAQLVNVEMCGVMLLSDDGQWLIGQAPLYGVQDIIVPLFKLHVGKDTPGQGLWHDKEWWYTNNATRDDFIVELDLNTLVEVSRVHALAFVPMIIGAQRIGAVMVANPRGGKGFVEGDLHLLAVLTSQVATVVENARLYNLERRRANELESLHRIAETINVLRQPRQFYGEITEKIAQLLNSQTCGVFLYDKESQALVAQPPFYGASEEASKFLTVSLEENSLPQEIWNRGGEWYSNHMLSETGLRQTDLGKFFEESDLRQGALGTLFVGDRKLGMILVANKIDETEFTPEDVRRMNIYGKQAAIFIDNAQKYQDAYRRAVETDGLRRIAERLAGAVEIDVVLQGVMKEIANLLECETVSVALLDSDEGNLVYSPDYTYGKKLDEEIKIDIFSPGFAHSVVLSRRIFASANIPEDNRVLPPYRPVVEKLAFKNALLVPIIIQNQSIGELAVANRLGGAFTEDDQRLMLAVSAQVAAAIDRTRLHRATDTDLRERVEELNALDRLGQELAESLDLERILEVARGEASRVTPAEGVTALVLSDPSEWVDEDSPVIENRVGRLPGLRSTLASVEEKAFISKTTVGMNDYLGSDLDAAPAQARSAIVQPILLENQVVGIIHAYSESPDVFNEKHAEFLVRVAKQTALAIANARRYREQIRLTDVLRSRAEQLSEVYKLGQMIREGRKLEDALARLAKSLSERLGFRAVLVNLWDDQAEVFRSVAHYGLTQARYEEYQQTTPTKKRIDQLLLERWRDGNCYFVPSVEQDDDLIAGFRMPEYTTHGNLVRGSRAWMPRDILIVPIRNEGQDLLGWFNIGSPMDGRRLTGLKRESLEIFAAEANFIIESHRTLVELQSDANVTRAERDRLVQLHEVAGQIQFAPDIPTRLMMIADGIRGAGWEKVRITMRDKNLDSTLLVHSGYSEAEARRLPAAVLSGRVWRDRLEDPAFQDLKLGPAYYLRYDNGWVKQQVLRGAKPRPERVEQDQWHPQDIIYLPLYGQDKNTIIGIIGMEQPTDGMRPTEDSFQPIALFASQAAAAIENTRLYLETVRQTETEQRLTDMMEAVAASLDMESVLRSLAEGLQPMIAFTRMHVALPGERGNEFNLRRIEVTSDEKVYLFDDDPVPMQKTAMGRCFRSNQQLTYHLKSEDETEGQADLKRWFDQGERITMMVPMVAGGRTMGVLRLGSELENAFGFEEHVELVRRMANLSAVSIEHSNLVNDLMASTGYNEAIVESIQQGIVVLDSKHNITSINAYMKVRYQWTDEAIGTELYQYQSEFEVFLKHSISMALEQGTPQHQFEIQDVDHEGNKIIRNFYAYPLREGEVVRGVVLLVEDVTERAILESDLAQRAEQLGALTRVSSQITSALESDEVIALVLEALESVMEFDGVSLWLRDEDRLRVVAARGYTDPDAASAEELIGLYVDIENSALFREMSDKGQVINVGDTGADDPRFPYGDERVYKNWLGAPLTSQGRVAGVIALEKRQPQYYRNHHEQLLLAFANQAAVALYNAQLFEQTTQRARALDAQTQRLSLLNRVAVSLSQSLDIENILEITLRETAQALDLKEAVAIKVDLNTNVGRVVVEYPRSSEEPQSVINLEGNRAVERLQETLLPLLIDKFKDDPLAADLQPWMRHKDIQSAMVVPLVVGGTVIGAMIFVSLEEDNPFTRERVDLAQTLASQAAIATQNASLFEQSVVRTHELETLFEAAQAIAVTLDLDEAIHRVATQILSALRADACSIALWDDIENRLEIRDATNAWGDADEQETVGTIYDLSDYPTREHVLRQREVALLRLDQPELHESEKSTMQRKGASDRMLVPLIVNEVSVGLIELEIREQNRFFEAADLRLARALASQSAVAIENARLQTETRSHIEELYIINDLSTTVSSAVEIEDLLPTVRDQLPVLTGAETLYVALFDSDREQLSFPIAVHKDNGAVAMPPRQLGLDEFSYVIRRKAPLLLWGMNMPDARRSYGITDPSLPDAKCFLCVPMLSGDQVVGVLAVCDDHDPRAFGLNDQRILTTVASQLGVAIYKARLLDQTRTLAEDLEKRVIIRTTELDDERQRAETLYEITAEVATSLDISRVLPVALERVAQAIGATTAVLLGVDEVSDRLFVLHSMGGIPVDDEMERTQLRHDEGLGGWIVANRVGVVIDDVQKDDRWVSIQDRDEIHHAAVGAPLEVGDDVRGVMMLFNAKPGVFGDNDLKLVAAAASQLANSMNNSELYSLIRDQAERLGAILRAEQVESIKNSAILDSVADGVMYANEHGTVVLFNTAAERILGISAERVVNRPILELAGFYGGASGDWLENIERWMKDPASHVSSDFVEVIIDLEDERVVSVRLSPVNMGDQFLGTVSVFRDITKMIEVDRMKTEFVATVSHELRTPMTSIKGYADLLLLGAAGEVSEAQQRFLETIKQNADRLSILVNDLLEVSRIDQQRVPMKFAALDVSELLEAVKEHLEERILDRKRTINIEVEMESMVPAIWADRDKITQALRNLSDNAFNYTHADGTVTLCADFDKKSESVIIAIKDNGIGMADEVKERLFERFYRGDEYDDLVLDTPGTGLGLAIVKSLVEMHDGEIWFDSKLGEGTTAYVRVPIFNENKHREAKPQEQ